MVSWLRGTKLRFKLEYSCHRPPLESVFLNLVISETIQWKLSRPRLFRDSNFLFLRDRDFSRLQIFKSLETETFPRLQFRVFRDRDFPRLGKSCRDRDFFETLADLWTKLLIYIWLYLEVVGQVVELKEYSIVECIILSSRKGLFTKVVTLH